MKEILNLSYLVELPGGKKVTINDLTNKQLIECINDRKKSFNIKEDLTYKILMLIVKNRGIKL